MRSCTALAAAVLLACGCQQSATEPGVAAGNDAGGDLSGAEAYGLACAQCHDTGEAGAPRIDDAAAWEGRSWLWEAVLFEHVKQGYGDMPARGGFEGLDDVAVKKAAEYLLQATSPAPPAD